MRVTVTFAILMLLASFQCISACTLAECGETQEQPQTPPCHHEKAPAPSHHSTHDQACDHQKTADQARPSMPELQFVADIDAVPFRIITLTAVFEPAHQVFASPPLLGSPSSILRI